MPPGRRYGRFRVLGLLGFLGFSGVFRVFRVSGVFRIFIVFRVLGFLVSRPRGSKLVKVWLVPWLCWQSHAPDSKPPELVAVNALNPGRLGESLENRALSYQSRGLGAHAAAACRRPRQAAGGGALLSSGS